MSDDFVEDAFEAPSRVDNSEGIYFGLDEKTYLSDVGLGSSDMKTLSYSPMGYWFNSRWNPLREPDEDTPAKLYGRAVHHIVLEGRDKFERLYGPKMHSWSTKEGKAEKERFAAAGKTALPFDSYSRALQTGAIIRGNPHLATAFEGSVGHEVSVFWERDGIKRRARFDGLKERAIVDLKNVANEKSISFPRACMRKIDDFSYHLQAEHYREGRLAMKRLLAEGKVFGEHDAGALARVAEQSEWAFVFIFIQSSGAPEVYPMKLSFKEESAWVDGDGEVHKDFGYMNDMFRIGRAKIQQAEKNFKDFRAKFGMETPWVSEAPIEEFDVGSMPSWFSRDVSTEST